MISITASIFSLIYIVLISLVYFSKGRLMNIENKIFSCMLIASIIGIFLDSVSGLLYFNNFDVNTFFYQFLTKFIILFYVVWDLMMLEYIIVISLSSEKKSKYLKIISSLIVVFCVVMILFPINIVVDGSMAHPEGIGIIIMYLITLILTFIVIFVLIKNYKKIKSKKYLPLFSYLLFGIIMLIVQNITGSLLITSVDIFITILMYFTIENPDMKLLKEMHDAKEISDNANEEKTLFLYNMTQEIRETTKNIDNEADIIIDSDSIDIDKESARNIKGEISKFRMITNDILDVSAIDATSIKIYNSKYNIKLLFKSLVSSYSEVCRNKGIEFRTNIEHNIPDLLYGDNISLKRALNLILSYSVKNTKKGYVELSVNTVIKNDIVRLIIMIEDSSMGIQSTELEKIKIDNKNISEGYKLITLMNGTMMFTSNYGMGNKIKVILDQKIDTSKEIEEKEYMKIYNNKKILIIDDSESGIKIIEKLLKGSNILIDYSLTGKDAINKIRTKNRYDLILLDEELSNISGIEFMKKLNSIRNFKIPVILLSKDNKYEYDEEYLSMGFSDILIKPLKKKELLDIIDKYIVKDEI